MHAPTSPPWGPGQQSEGSAWSKHQPGHSQHPSMATPTPPLGLKLLCSQTKVLPHPTATSLARGDRGERGHVPQMALQEELVNATGKLPAATEEQRSLLQSGTGSLWPQAQAGSLGATSATPVLQHPGGMAPLPSPLLPRAALLLGKLSLGKTHLTTQV